MPNTITERKQVVLDLPTFSKKRIQKNYEWFDFNVYKGQKSIFKILDSVIIRKLETKPLFMNLYMWIRQTARRHLRYAQDHHVYGAFRPACAERLD